jgi:ankyrin repeat protein
MSVGTTSALATNALSASWKLEDKGEIGTRHHLLNTPASHTETPTPASAEREHMEGMDKSNESRRLLLDYDDFHDAIKYGDFDSVKQMLDDGANVERDTDDGETPLVLAIHKQHTDIITLLLENGADVNYPSNDLPPLFHAVTQKERAPHIIQLLLDYGAHLDAVVGPSDMTALHWAAVHGMKHAVDILVSKGSSMSRTCAKGQTPFTLAAENGHLVVVQLLLAKGADLHERSSNGGSALIWAASRGQHEVVDYLLSAGSKVDDRSKDGLSKSRQPFRLGGQQLM